MKFGEFDFGFWAGVLTVVAVQWATANGVHVVIIVVSGAVYLLVYKIVVWQWFR